MAQGFDGCTSKENPKGTDDKRQQEVHEMAYSIRTAEVQRVFRPVLGGRLTSETWLCERVAELLRGYRPSRTTMDGLCAQLKNLIFGELYELLGTQMLLQMDNGAVRRIMLRDVDFLVDEAAGVLLDVMAPPEITLEGLRAFAMERGSLAAMRVLLERYDDALPEMEKEMLRRIIRENHPNAGFGQA